MSDDDVLADGFSASIPIESAAEIDEPDVDIELQDQVVTTRLEQALAETAALVAEVEERHADDHDPAPAAQLQAICEAADAPLELQSLLRRVEDGVVTWDDVWRSPGAHDGGMLCLARLVQSFDPATWDPAADPAVDPAGNTSP